MAAALRIGLEVIAGGKILNERDFVAWMEFLSAPRLALARLEVLAGYLGLCVCVLAAIVLALVHFLL